MPFFIYYRTMKRIHQAIGIGILSGVLSLSAASLSGAPAASRPAEPVGGPVRVTLTFDDSLKDHLLIAAPLLEAHGWRGTFNIVTDWVGAGDRFLSWGDVRELVRRGHEIATHTKTHRNLLKLLKDEGEAAVRRELAVSRDAIADATGFTPRFMCPPFLAQSEETARLCRAECLRQMIACRINFGQGAEGKTRAKIASRLTRGVCRLDLMHHGLSAEGFGGWKPFRDRAAFERHLNDIAALEREGKIIVTDYDGMVSDCRLRASAWPRHGIVALSFDDRNMASWEKAFPVFAAHGATATFFISGAIGADEVRFARRALAMGHEVGLHGFRHRNADTALAGRGADRYWREEIEPQLAAFRTAGVSIRSFAYPNCRRTPETDRVFVARGFTRLRGTPDGVAIPNPYDPKGKKLDRWHPVASCDPVFVPSVRQLPSHVIGNVLLGEAYHTDMEDIIRAMRRAGERAETLSLASHAISPGATGISMKTAWLERMLSEADASGVVVRGVR